MSFAPRPEMLAEDEIAFWFDTRNNEPLPPLLIGAFLEAVSATLQRDGLLGAGSTVYPVEVSEGTLLVKLRAWAANPVIAVALIAATPQLITAIKANNEPVAQAARSIIEAGAGSSVTVINVKNVNVIARDEIARQVEPSDALPQPGEMSLSDDLVLSAPPSTKLPSGWTNSLMLFAEEVADEAVGKPRHALPADASLVLPAEERRKGSLLTGLTQVEGRFEKTTKNVVFFVSGLRSYPVLLGENGAPPPLGRDLRLSVERMSDDGKDKRSSKTFSIKMIEPV